MGSIFGHNSTRLHPKDLTPEYGDIADKDEDKFGETRGEAISPTPEMEDSYVGECCFLMRVQ